MRKDKLNQTYPWTIDPMVSNYAEQFTEDEWAIINQSDIPRLIKEKILVDHYIIALLESIKLVHQTPQARYLSFRDLVQNQIMVLKSLESTPGTQALVAVAAWLTEPLINRLVKSNEEMDNLVQLLSSEKTRAMLAGDPKALAELSSIPLVFKKYAGKDLRDLLRTNQLSFKEFTTIASSLYTQINRKFPAWVGNNLELKGYANHFTDAQLATIERLAAPGLLNNGELKNGLLQTILAVSKLNGVSKIADCTHAQFERLVFTTQRNFLRMYNTHSPAVVPKIQGFFTGNGVNMNDNLIRFYLKAYSKPDTPLPTDAIAKSKLFEATLRNAANQGNFWDVLVLIHEVANLNSVSKDGKTALHYAAQYAAKYGDRLCFDLLAGQKGIDFSLMDNDQKTALAYWDFTKLPDDSLLQKLYRPPEGAQLPAP